MKLSVKTVHIQMAHSEIHPEFEFEHPSAGDLTLLQWADAHPNVWRIALGKTRSHTYAPGSSTFMGFFRGGDSPKAVLGRIGGMYQDWRTGEESLFGWRSRFAIDHCRDKGFTGGFFRQFDGKYGRGCIDLDFTPKTLTFAVNRFREWCGKDFPTVHITLKKGKEERIVWSDPEAVPWSPPETVKASGGETRSFDPREKIDEDDLEMTSDEEEDEESE